MLAVGVRLWGGLRLGGSVAVHVLELLAHRVDEVLGQPVTSPCQLLLSFLTQIISFLCLAHTRSGDSIAMEAQP